MDRSIVLSCIAVVLCVASTLQAQTVTDPLNSDRPDQSEGPFVLACGMVQVESGTLLEEAGGTSVVQNTMLRFGINGSTEARLLIDAGYDGSRWGFYPVGLSLKQKLVRPKGPRPDVALVGYVYLHPLATAEHRDATLSSTWVVAAENALGERFSVTYTAGGSFNDIDPVPTAIITTQGLFRPRPDVAVFAEYFGHFGNGILNGADAGIMYHPMPQIMLDVAGAAMHTAGGWGGYVTVGMCWRFGFLGMTRTPVSPAPLMPR